MERRSLELKLELKSERCPSVQVGAKEAGAEARAEELKLPKRRAEAAITARRRRLELKLELKS